MSIKKEMLCFALLHGMLYTAVYGYTPIAAVPGTTVWQIEDTVQGIILGNKIITQANLPVTITTPGSYSIAQDLTLSATRTITISASDVVLDLKGHIVTATQGIAMVTVGGNNVTICNGSLYSVASGTTFVTILSGVDGVLIDNMALYAPGAQAGTFGIFCNQNCTNAIIRNCDFTYCGYGILFNITCSGGHISACRFNNCNSGSVVIGPGSSSFLIDNLTIARGGSGIILSDSTNIDVENVHMSQVGLTASDAGVVLNSSNFSTIRNISVVGTSTQTPSFGTIPGIWIEGGEDYIIEDCAINGASGDGILVGINGVLNSVVQGCTINSCAGIGINVTAPPTPTNHFYNNLSSNNGVADFAGVAPILIATSDIQTSTSVYWKNVGY